MVHLAIAHVILGKLVTLARGALHASHPVRQLLEPHFTAVILNLEIGKRLLTSPQGMIDELLPLDHASNVRLIQSASDNFQLVSLNPHIEVAKRGCDDPTQLGFYPYRDDGFLLYDAMHHYVQSILSQIYQQQGLDSEVQQWQQDLEAAFSDQQRAGWSLNTVDDLVDWVTGIMYLSSAFHSAVNYPQWDHTMFVPSMPAALYASPDLPAPPLPNLLPPIERFIRQIEVLWLLSGNKMERIGDVPPLSGFEAEHANYLTALSGIEQQLQAAVRPFPYPYLHPSNVTAAANL
jgi:hypothetical protein